MYEDHTYCALFQSQLSESDFSAADAVSAVLKEQRELIEKNESLLMAQNESLLGVEKSMSESADAVNTMNDRVDTLEEELNKILAMTGEMQASACMCMETTSSNTDGGIP